MCCASKGYFVVTPFETVTGLTLMVNRGWIPRHYPDSNVPWDKPTHNVRMTVVPYKGEGERDR